MVSDRPEQPGQPNEAEHPQQAEQVEPPEAASAATGGQDAQRPEGDEAAERPARPARAPRAERAHPAVAEAEVVLDDKAKALSALMMKTLAPFQPEMGAVTGDVVATVKREQAVEACAKLRDDPETACNYLRCLSVVDYEDRFEVVYHLYSIEKLHRMAVKVSLPYNDPTIPSVISIWGGADWYEREAHDLFGVVFEGHPNLSPLLLYEGFEGYPGRKSYPINDYQEW